MLGEKIKHFRKLNNLNQRDFADNLHVSHGLISMWENNLRTPDINTIKEIANALNISIDELLEDNKPNRIPVLGKIPAGIPIEMIEDVIDYEDISPEMLLGNKTYFALKIKGDSMSPKFLENDILIVKQQDDCNSGDYAIVAVNGFDATFKKVIKKESGIILQPLNPNYEPIMYSNEEIEKLPVRILGIVVEIRRSL